jgi:hypothetical protein
MVCAALSVVTAASVLVVYGASAGSPDYLKVVVTMKAEESQSDWKTARGTPACRSRRDRSPCT